MKDKELIPPGVYCYTLDITKDNWGDEFPIVRCPYSTYKDINGVKIPWCSYINEGSVPNDLDDDGFKKLEEYFGSENNVFDFLKVDLLWDDVKECNENRHINETREDIINWIKKVKDERVSDNT